MTNIPTKVWKLSKRMCVPICDRCFNIFEKDNMFLSIGYDMDISNSLCDETEYRSNWSDQNFCIFCYIHDMLDVFKSDIFPNAFKEK